MELAYIRDQREKIGTTGAFQMGNTDAKESKKIAQSLERKAEEEAAAERRRRKEEEEAAELQSRADSFEAEMTEMEMRDDETLETKDDDASPSFQHRETDDAIRAKLNADPKNTTHFPNAVEQGLRYEVSREATAAIVTGTLVDVGIISKEDTSKIVTKRKIQLEVDRCLKQFQVPSMIYLLIDNCSER